MRVTFLFEVRQELETVLLAKLEQILPIVHSEKRFVASIVVGFI
jgi:hypothetical protein